MTWQCYNDKMSLRELAGIRGIAPSVKFNYNSNGESGNDFIYHIPSNEKVYLWGVELFSNGYDCVEIYRVEEDGTELKIKNAGFGISNFDNSRYFEYKFDSVSIYEHPSFEDFWNDPYLIKKDQNKILKSNFFRCFSFANDGIYKIVLDERYNPDYLDSSFLPVDYGSEDKFNGNLLVYDNIATDSAAGIEDGAFRRVIYVKVITRLKDIVKEKVLNRIVKKVSPGYIDLYDKNEYEKLAINNFSEFSSYTISGFRSYFIKNKFINGGFVFFETSELNSNISEEDLIEFEESYKPVYTQNFNSPSFVPGNKYLYCRNLLVENCIFSNNIYSNKSLFFYEQEHLNSSIRNTNDGYGPVYDLRGSIFINCHFINDAHSMLSESNIDGCVFDNCVFENCSFSEIKSSGILFKNCQWKGASYSHLSEELGMICGESNCVMGCSFEYTGKVFNFKSWQPIYNSIFIRNCSYGTDRVGLGGDIFSASNLSADGGININSGFYNNISIMNSHTKSSGSFISIKNVKAKLNLSCFNLADNINFDEIYADLESVDICESSYNVCMHNGCMAGGGVYLSGHSNSNRWIDVVWGNPSFKESMYKFKKGEFHYQPAPFFEILSQQDQIPSRNIISNCAIVNFQEYHNFYGNTSVVRDNNFKIINIDNDITELNNGSNLILNLRKIVRQYY